MRLPPELQQIGSAGYEPALVASLERLVRPGFVCADLGANVGILSLVLAQLVGEAGTVFAFEAAADNVEQLRTNMQLNPSLASRITVVEGAVTDGSVPTVELYRARSGSDAEWTISEAFAARADAHPTARRPVKVRALALDAFFEPGQRLDLIKMDIEGAEAQAVKGMRRLLREAHPVVVLEFHREEGWPAIPLLLESGYRLERLDGTPLPDPKDAAEVPYQLIAKAAC
jgi:FkbM family methyltransferase